MTVHLCARLGTPCVGVCVARTEYEVNTLTGGSTEHFAELEEESRALLETSFPGRNLSEVSLHSSHLLSVSLLHPITGQEFLVVNQTQPVFVTLPLSSPQMPTGSRLACAHRSTSSSRWTIDNTRDLVVTMLGGNPTVTCSFTHLTQFAVVIIPPPLPTTVPPPTTSPATTTSPTTQPTTTPLAITSPTTLPPLTTQPPVTDPVISSTPVGAIAGGLIGGLVLVGLFLLLLFVQLRKKKQKAKIVLNLKTRLEDDTVIVNNTSDINDGSPVSDGPRPKTAVNVSRDRVKVVALGTDDSRKQIGDVLVPHEARLRELRNIITSSYPQIQSKFYFLKQDMTVVEPVREQSLSVRVVYDGAAFLREVSPEYLASSKNALAGARLHFCICDEVANFECPECSAVGYCSTECQDQDWENVHQKECHRLAEQHSRQRVLANSHRPSAIGIAEATAPERSLARRTSRQSVDRPTTWSTFVRNKSTTSLTVAPLQVVPGDTSYRNRGATAVNDPNAVPGDDDEDDEALVPDNAAEIVVKPSVAETSFSPRGAHVNGYAPRRVSIPGQRLGSTSPKKEPGTSQTAGPGSLGNLRMKSQRRDTFPLESLNRQTSTSTFQSPPSSQPGSPKRAFSPEIPAEDSIPEANAGDAKSSPRANGVAQHPRQKKSMSVTSIASTLSSRLGKSAKVADSSGLDTVSEGSMTRLGDSSDESSRPMKTRPLLSRKNTGMPVEKSPQPASPVSETVSGVGSDEQLATQSSGTPEETPKPGRIRGMFSRKSTTIKPKSPPASSPTSETNVSVGTAATAAEAPSTQMINSAEKSTQPGISVESAFALQNSAMPPGKPPPTPAATAGPSSSSKTSTTPTTAFSKRFAGGKGSRTASRALSVKSFTGSEDISFDAAPETEGQQAVKQLLGELVEEDPADAPELV